MNKLTLLLTTTIGTASLALAQGLPAFEEVDTNQDGSISRDEASVVEGLDFDSIDANQDGLVSPEEYAAA
jgi:hypothetical protein